MKCSEVILTSGEVLFNYLNYDLVNGDKVGYYSTEGKARTGIIKEVNKKVVGFEDNCLMKVITVGLQSEQIFHLKLDNVNMSLDNALNLKYFFEYKKEISFLANLYER